MLVGPASSSKRLADMPVTRVKKAHPDLGQPIEGVVPAIVWTVSPLGRSRSSGTTSSSLQELSFGYGHPELEGVCALGPNDPAGNRLGMRHVRCQYTHAVKGCALSGLHINYPAHARDRASKGARRPGARCRSPRSLTGDPPHPSRGWAARRGSSHFGSRLLQSMLYNANRSIRSLWPRPASPCSPSRSRPRGCRRAAQAGYRPSRRSG